MQVPVAQTVISRLLGLSHLDYCEAGEGLLIPRCSAVHTFGMRFTLDLLFLDRSLRPLRRAVDVGPGRFICHSGSWAVLEVPVKGGENTAAGA